MYLMICNFCLSNNCFLVQTLTVSYNLQIGTVIEVCKCRNVNVSDFFKHAKNYNKQVIIQFFICIYYPVKEVIILPYLCVLLLSLLFAFDYIISTGRNIKHKYKLISCDV